MNRKSNFQVPFGHDRVRNFIPTIDQQKRQNEQAAWLERIIAENERKAKAP
jgi:hypothetical protein